MTPTRAPHVLGKQTSAALEAEALVPSILAFLAGDPERLSRFADLTGFTPRSLRQAAEDPSFAAILLDYLCSDDRLLITFAADQERDPATIDALRQRLAIHEDR